MRETVIEVSDLTKKYADKTAVRNLTFQLMPGMITGFLGPNGAGKSTTLRMILNLTLPTSGTVRVGGEAYANIENPLKKIGAMLDAALIDPRLTPRQYLRILATMSALAEGVVEDVLQRVGLDSVKDKKIEEFSLGMRQRVGLAAALIGDPDVLILDEPFNGLDVEGIHWLRILLRDLAEHGKAVFISSHLLSEVQEVADRIILLAQGELIADMTMGDLMEKSQESYVLVRVDAPERLQRILAARGATAELVDGGDLQVRTMSCRDIGNIAFEHNLRVYGLVSHRPSLEQLFAELIGDRSDYRGEFLCGEEVKSAC